MGIIVDHPRSFMGLGFRVYEGFRIYGRGFAACPKP